MKQLNRLDLYSDMVRIRQYEARIMQEYHADKTPAWDIGAGLIPGEMHLAAGQEPAAVGVCAHLKKGDAITAPHRPHHFALSHGVDMNAMTAEIYGRTTGLCKGKGGHMHLFDPENHFSCSGIIAQGYPVACGQALAMKRRGTDNVEMSLSSIGRCDPPWHAHAPHPWDCSIFRNTSDEKAAANHCMDSNRARPTQLPERSKRPPAELKQPSSSASVGPPSIAESIPTASTPTPKAGAHCSRRADIRPGQSIIVDRLGCYRTRQNCCVAHWGGEPCHELLAAA